MRHVSTNRLSKRDSTMLVRKYVNTIPSIFFFLDFQFLICMPLLSDFRCKRHSSRKFMRQLYHDFAKRGGRGADEED